MKKQNTITLLALAIFATSAALSPLITPVNAQFIDRILRPCGGTSTASVVVTTTNITMVPCPGGSVTINGVPITPGGGGTVTGTGTTNNLTKWTNGAGGVLGDAPITDVLGVLLLGNPAVTNSILLDADQVIMGDVDATANGTVVTLTDSSKTLDVQFTGGGGTFSVTNTPGGNGAGLIVSDAQGITLTGDSTFAQVHLLGGAFYPGVGITMNLGTPSFPWAELLVNKTIRTTTASDTDLAGDLTIGAGGTATFTFTQTYATAPVCVCSDTNASPLICGASATTTTLTVRGNVGNVVNYVCIGRN